MTSRLYRTTRPLAARVALVLDRLGIGVLHGNHEYIVTNDSGADLTTVVLRKVSRWQVETLFRDAKQYAGLEACQCRVDQAMVRHIGLVLLTFVVMQMMRRTPEESVGSVKERWQLEVMRDGESPPPLLKACPPHLRPTA